MATNSNYSLNVLNITSRQGGKIDLIPYMAAIEIFEDIYSPFMLAQIDLIETKSIIETLPIVGDEYVDCEIRVHGINNFGKRDIKFKMDVYKIEDEQKYRHKGTSFRILLISQSFRINANKRNRKYYNDIQSNIVALISETQLQEPIMRIDACKYQEEYIFPNWHPVGCINHLSKNSVSARYGDPDFVFYEDLDGYNYLSMSYMIDEGNGKVEPTVGGNFKSMIIKEFNNAEGDFNVSEYHKKHTFDIVNNVNFGMYGTELIYHDVTNRKWRDTNDTYNSTYDKFEHVGFLPLTLLSDDSYKKNRIQLLPMNGLLNPGVYKYDFYTDQKKQLIIRQLQTEQNLMVLEVDGEPNMKIGYPMTFELMSIKNDNVETDHEKLYGDFLITKIRHLFKREKYKQFVEISKDSYET